MDDPANSVPQESLVAAMAHGGTVVTSTRRLARALLARHARHAVTDSWATPRVLPWSAWVQATFRDLRDFGAIETPRACLDDVQSIALWEEVLAADAIAATLLMPGGAAESCRDAWHLVYEWQLDWRQLGARAGEDGRIFLRIAAAYRRRLEWLECLDGAGLASVLARALAGRDGPPVLFAGFDRFHPAQRVVVAALGARAGVVAAPDRRGRPTLAPYPDSRRELAAAAAWARTRLAADPAARLGIVVPELESQAPLLEDLLDEALVPSRLLHGHADGPRPWNLSLGRPLVDLPVVATALRAFALVHESLEFADVSRLLRSPFIAGDQQEAGHRARLEAWLREHAGERIAPARLLGWLDGRDGAPPCPLLAAGISGLLEEIERGPRRRRPSAWAAALTRALARLGWPGDGPADSATWQTVQAWSSLLEAFSRLDVVVGPLGLGDALARLRRSGAAQRFQPETPDLPVQVLGLLDTAGLEFDGIRVTGMHDGILPQPLRPCPLLPAALQREQRMPRACPDTELALARHTVARLAGAAAEVCFSYPEMREDEPLRPSPVVTSFPAAESRAAPEAGIAATIFAARRLESLPDTAAPPVHGDVRGGSSLLAAQSACPFKAFAVHRLAACVLDAPTAGVDPATRGQFVHHALHELWGKLMSRAALAALDPAALQERVRAALQDAARRLLAGQPPGLVEIEIEDAMRRVLELLDIEVSRPAFEVVQREQRVSIDLGGLRINGQVDRVDRVPGGLVIIDYKTGEAGARNWHGERPAEPQMPLYAQAFRAELAGLAYATLKPGAVGFAGMARSADVLGPALSGHEVVAEETWQERLDEWRSVLEALAGAFAAGDARVDPLHLAGPDGTCARCHLATLCRRDELLQAGMLADD